jgi:hypothetical protein
MQMHSTIKLLIAAHQGLAYPKLLTLVVLGLRDELLFFAHRFKLS